MKRLAISALACVALSWAQTEAPLTFEQTVSRAMQQYPSIKVSEARTAEAAAAIQLARTAYLPKVDVLAGVNRATRNNIFGLLLPSQTIAPISGPVLGTNDLTTVWGSTAGALVTWEPYDFGRRRSALSAAEAGRARAQAGVERARFEAGALAADAFLTLLAAEQTVKAAQAGVDRAATLARTVAASVNAELRPGAELSRAQAEQAAATTQLIRAEQAVAEAKAALSLYTGSDPTRLAVLGGNLLSLPPVESEGPATPTHNPIAEEQNATLNEARAQRKALNYLLYPRLQLQGAGYGRGSGAQPNGATEGGLNGLGPNIQNWAAGFTATLPLLEFPAIRARQAAQDAVVKAESSRYDQLLAELSAKVATAKAQLEGSRRVAANTPTVVEAARNALTQTTARYQAGLSNIAEAAEAQRLLTQAEIDDALARLSVWRAWLALAAAQGDLAPLLQQAGR